MIQDPENLIRFKNFFAKILKDLQLLSIDVNSSVLNLAGFLDQAQLIQLFIVLLV